MNIEETFDSVQGEGLLTGFPAHFIRVWGCNAEARDLECAKWCDTKYAWEPKSDICQRWSVGDLIDHVDKVTLPLIIFTGGEPLLYKNTITLWLEEHPEVFEKHLIAVETNGIITRTSLPKGIWFTVSPKPPFYKISQGPVHEIKVIVPPEALTSPNWFLNFKGIAQRPTFVGCQNLTFQPQDNSLETAKYIANDLLPQMPNWRLGLQVHKLLEIR